MALRRVLSPYPLPQGAGGWIGESPLPLREGGAGGGVTNATPLAPVFLISFSAVAFEIALTRFFAVTAWSEYGYWVISIVMAGFALSGVALALLRDTVQRFGGRAMGWLPPLLVLAAGLGYRAAGANPFNPLQLQNQVTWASQLWNIAGYYAALLPFFFLAGLFIGMSFVLNPRRIGIVYGWDLGGAGAGAACVTVLMFVLPPLELVPALLVPLAASAVLVRRGVFPVLAAAAALVACEAVLLLGGPARVNEYKPIYAPEHTAGARVLATRLSPRGQYQLLDDFTERVDTDISNDAEQLGLGGPPRAFGLYRDGNRIAALPRTVPEVGYAKAALDAAPYRIESHPRVLLIGASGGFRVAEILALGASHVDALEPDPVLAAALRHGLGPVAPMAPDGRVRLRSAPPLAAAQAGAGYGVIDISADFLDAAEANVTAFTVEALAADLRALAPGGILSIPVSIRDFPIYALRVLSTVRAALLEPGADPTRRVVIGTLRLGGAAPGLQRGLEPETRRRATLFRRRTVLRCVVLSGRRRRVGAGEHLQRPAGGLLRRRDRGKHGPRRLDRRRGERGARRDAHALRGDLQPDAGDARPAVLLRGAAALSAAHAARAP